ncbi:MAG: hypothetical protein DRP84_07930, partial [Spirochaetes bacterium]
MIKNILLALIPVFIAVDAIGLTPIFISYTFGLAKEEKKKIILQSMVTAGALTISFIFIGKWIFNILGLKIGDFMVAGGILLFCIAILEIVGPEKKDKISQKDIGVVPLGTPLIAGPAVLTTSLIIIEEYGLIATLLSVVMNILITGGIFSISSIIQKILG